MGLQDSFIYNGVCFKTGDKITCIIDDAEINDAKIYICDEMEGEGETNEDTVEFYICQDVMPGNESPDKLGYDCSWKGILHLNVDSISDQIYELKRACNDELANIVRKAFPIKR